MNNSLDQLCEEVNALEDTYRLVLENAKLESLWQAAKDAEQTDPEQALKCLTVLAVKSLQFPHDWHDMRMNILRDTIRLIDRLQGKDFVFPLRFAEYCKAKGNYIAAGHNYNKAADALSRDGISFLKSDPPGPPDLDLKHYYLREAMASFQLGGDSKRASDCYIEAQRFVLSRSTGGRRFWMQLNWLVWGWGERPLRVVVSGTLLITLYAALYLYSGIDPHAADLIGNAINCIYFSAITFATVGYGDLHPASNFSKLLAASEGLFGIFFTGLFLVTFVKRHAR